MNFIDKTVSVHGLVCLVHLQEVLHLILPDLLLFQIAIVCMEHGRPELALLPGQDFLVAVQQFQTPGQKCRDRAEVSKHQGDCLERFHVCLSLRNVHMDIVCVNGVTVAQTRQGGEIRQHLGRCLARDMKVHCFAIQVPGVGNAAHVGVVGGTADAAVGGERLAEVLTDIVNGPDHPFLGLRREAVAVLSAALAPEFCPGKVFDVIPPQGFCSRLR